MEMVIYKEVTKFSFYFEPALHFVIDDFIP